MKRRISYIDSAKGIGIILVIFGHLLSLDSPLSSIIYSFHMPFFFLVSGIFANASGKFFPYLSKQIKRLLVPFLIVFAIGMAVTFIIPSLRLQKITDVIPLLIYARPIEINVGPIWFLACLFDVTIFFWIYYKLILSKNKLLINLISLGILTIIAFFLPKVEEKIGFQSPFKLDVAVMALVFYIIGFLLKRYFLSENFGQPLWVRITQLVFTLPIVILLPYYFIGQTYLSGGMYGPDLFWYVFTAFCGSIFVLTLGLICSKVRLLTVEAFTLKAFGQESVSFIFMTLPTAYFLFSLISQIIWNLNGKVCTLLGSASLIIYCFHPMIVELFIDIVPSSILLFIIVSTISVIVSFATFFISIRISAKKKVKEKTKYNLTNL